MRDVHSSRQEIEDGDPMMLIARRQIHGNEYMVCWARQSLGNNEKSNER